MLYVTTSPTCSYEEPAAATAAGLRDDLFCCLICYDVFLLYFCCFCWPALATTFCVAFTESWHRGSRSCRRGFFGVVMFGLVYVYYVCIHRDGERERENERGYEIWQSIVSARSAKSTCSARAPACGSRGRREFPSAGEPNHTIMHKCTNR